MEVRNIKFTYYDKRTGKETMVETLVNMEHIQQ